MPEFDLVDLVREWVRAKPKYAQFYHTISQGSSSKVLIIYDKPSNVINDNWLMSIDLNGNCWPVGDNPQVDVHLNPGNPDFFTKFEEMLDGRAQFVKQRNQYA